MSASASLRKMFAPGPFTVDQLREGSPYEISNGHAIFCAPSGDRHGGTNLIGGALLLSDPAVDQAGTDVGHKLVGQTVRAPDISVGGMTGEPGWAQQAPALAVEYADRGQDEDELREKIADLLGAGTRYVWVVRLTGPHRVEVYEPGCPKKLVAAEGTLKAPGILRNPVTVEALYNRRAARALMLRNLLQSEGYKDLEELRRESEKKGERLGKKKGEREGERSGRAQSLLTLLEARGLTVSPAHRTRILKCRDVVQLEAWLRKSVVAERVADIFS